MAFDENDRDSLMSNIIKLRTYLNITPNNKQNHEPNGNQNTSLNRATNGRSDIYESFWFAFKAMLFLQDKDEPRQRLNSIAENENNSDLSSEETGAPSVDEDIQVSENVEQTASEPSVQNLQQIAPQPPVENLVRMAPPSRKPTKRSRTNDERLDKAFSISETSVSAPIQNEESECQIFGKLVAKKLHGYSPDDRSIAQEELMKISFKADRGFYNNMSNQQPPPMQYPVPVQSISQQNLYKYPPPVNHNSSLNLNHPHCNPSNPNEILGRTPSPATTRVPQHSPASNYSSHFTPNTPASSSMDNDDADSKIYEILLKKTG
ncbi:hypothetical protein JTB14_035703 [Gonioctena quinquepunctata]|nr:hypothetical protein JTB14_035703 [Gonioctena quinquepunctata]